MVDMVYLRNPIFEGGGRPDQNLGSGPGGRLGEPKIFFFIWLNIKKLDILEYFGKLKEYLNE